MIATCGGQWQRVTLVMFNVYFDDSGTAPDQRIAIASALIIPANRILALENEWKGFCDKYGITELHASECAWQNPKSQYADWNEAKIGAAFDRARQIVMKYGIRAFSFAVTKKEFDEEVPDEHKVYWAQDHYAYAIRRVLRFIWKWSGDSEFMNRLDYVFDSGSKKVEGEIDRVLLVEESFRPGSLEGRYSFRKRQEWPGLQCADVLAWTCCCQARNFFEGTPMNPYAEKSIREFANFRSKEWLTGVWTTREDLRGTVQQFKQIYGESVPSPSISIFNDAV